MAKQRRLNLKRNEKKVLAELMSKGRESVRVIKRARALQMLGQGRTERAVAEAVGVAVSTIGDIKRRFWEGGLERVLKDGPRGRHEPVIGSKEGERLVAMLCGPSPSGRARWSIRLARDEAVARKIVPKVGRETIRVFIHGHRLKPWREKNVVRARGDAGVSREDGGRS
jgi:putative transposase